MTDPEAHYTRAHKLLDAARTALAGHETDRAVRLLIDAVEASTMGWGAIDDEEDLGVVSAQRPPPSLRDLMIQGKNCVSGLNEYAQQLGQELPQYTFSGGGVFQFQCTCSFAGHEVESAQAQRTKNEAKHDAAERMLDFLRKELP